VGYLLWTAVILFMVERFRSRSFLHSPTAYMHLNSEHRSAVTIRHIV